MFVDVKCIGRRSGSAHAYHFLYWSMIDIFIYFSHSRITIPPVVWTNAAHRHGLCCVLLCSVSQWMNERMNEGMKEWRNEWMNEWCDDACVCVWGIGVRMLGTVITEWAEGALDNLRLLDGPIHHSSSATTKFNPFYADRLVELCCYYGFDGWFINIESDVPLSHVPKLVCVACYP